MLEYSTTINFPSASREAEAIAWLNLLLWSLMEPVQAPLGETVDWFLKPGYRHKMGAGWKAVQKGPDTYEVQLNITDASNGGPAIWEADVLRQNGAMLYIAQTAKNFRTSFGLRTIGNFLGFLGVGIISSKRQSNPYEV